MKNLSYVIGFLSLLLIYSSCKEEGAQQEANEKEAISAVFPDDYFGKYAGTLNVYNNNYHSSVGMELHINPSDTIGKYDYTIVYIKDGVRQNRNYSLLTLDRKRGYYQIDENNGVIINQYFSDGKMYSTFEVAENLLTSIVDFETKDEIEYELIFANMEDMHKSVDKKARVANDVKSFQNSVLQKAILKRIE